MTVVTTVEQLSSSFDSTMSLSGSTQARLVSVVPLSAVMKTLIVILIESPGFRSPTHSTTFTGFWET